MSCLCGLLLQVHNLSLIYFSYKTTSRIIPHLQDELPCPALALCIRYLDILDPNRAQAYGINIESSEEELSQILSNFTVPVLFELTPR
jgi:hypothetical protein